jgi:hypothetical protein
MQGYLTKPNKSFGSKKRFFVLDRNILSYFETDSKSAKLADIFLNAQTRVSASGTQQINIDSVSVGTKQSEKTSYVLLCSNPQHRDQWVAALQTACNFEDSDRLKNLATLDAERRDAEERARREAEEADRLKKLATLDAERRDAEERARREAEEADRLRLKAEKPPSVIEVPEPETDLIPRVSPADINQAVYKARY